MQGRPPRPAGPRRGRRSERRRPEANQDYDNLGKTFEYYADTFGRDSYDDSGAELIASINFCENPGTPTHNAYWTGTR